MCTTFAGSFGRPRTGCGARYGVSVSARIRSAGTRPRRSAAPTPSGRSRCRRTRRSSRARAQPGAGRSTRSSGGRPCRRSRRARRACPRPQRGCGRRPAFPSRRRPRAVARTAAAGRRAARSRGTSRGRSPRPRPRAGERAAPRTSADAGVIAGPAACGWMPEDRVDPVVRSAKASAARQPSTVVPTVRMRVTPASGARHDRPVGSSSASRCACVSITQQARVRRPAGTAAVQARSPPLPPPPRRDPVEREVPRLPERLEDPRRGLGEVRRQRDGDRDDAVGEVVEDAVELGRPRLVLCQVPRRGRLDVLVQGAHRLPDRVERAGDVVPVELLDDCSRGRPRRRRPARATSPAGPCGSGRSSRSSGRRGCRGRSRARSRSALGSSRARRSRPGRTSPGGRTRTAPRRRRRRRSDRAG